MYDEDIRQENRMYKAIQFSPKFIHITYCDEYGMDVLSDERIYIYRMSDKDKDLVEDSRVSQRIEDSECYSKEIETPAKWKFVMQKGIEIMNGFDLNRLHMTLH